MLGKKEKYFVRKFSIEQQKRKERRAAMFLKEQIDALEERHFSIKLQFYINIGGVASEVNPPRPSLDALFNPKKLAASSATARANATPMALSNKRKN